MAYLYNHRGDPFDSNIIPSGNQKHVQSAYYSGTEYLNITAPASANYPDESPTRYFIELPLVPDVSDLAGTMPILIRDVTSSTNLTRVTSAPGVNQYRIVVNQNGVFRPQILELHSGQAGHIIGYDYYGKVSIINANITHDLEIDSTIVIYKDSAGVLSNKTLFKKIYEIGDWNMDSTVSVSINHDLDISKIINVEVSILTDAISGPILNSGHQTAQTIGANNTYGNIAIFTSATAFQLIRTDSGFFDNNIYDQTSYNRGYIIVTHFK